VGYEVFDKELTKNKAFDIAIRAGHQVRFIESVWRFCDDDPEVLLIALELNDNKEKKIV
jgi:hypothetical protein